MRLATFRSAIAFVSVLGVVGIACSAPADEVQDDGEGVDSAEGDFTGYKPGCEAKKLGSYALGGTILTPTGPVQGYVVVRDEKIAAIAKTKADVPKDVTNVVDTGAIISPGFMDLHNHVAYDFIPLWKSGKRFQNRYQWARIADYGPAVKDPYNKVKAANHLCEAVKYGEFRAMAGGTTTIQGSVDTACVRSWVRNVEFVNFCEDHIRQDVLPINGISQDDANQLSGQFASGQTKAFFVHLAEGIDDTSRKEFEQLRAVNLLQPQVVGIHSTALNEDQLAEMGKVGMKIVWSPLSNLMLYGQTTNIPAAIKSGVKVALAPDWAPSGTPSALTELKIADRVNKERFNGFLTDQQLWEMTTKNPSEIAGLDDKLGTIEAGKYADLVVIKGDTTKPYRAIIDSKPEDLVLTTIGGEAFYGDGDLLKAIGAKRTFTTVDACGTKRQLSVVESDTRITGGAQTLDQLEDTLQSTSGIEPTPLFECDLSKYDFAFE